MKHFDLFSGYGGFSLALQRVYANNNSGEVKTRETQFNGHTSSNGDNELSRLNNIQAPQTIGFSEIDKYASAVLKYHWPKIKNYGDITKIDWSEVPDFDLLTGGSPCQDLSIAGKRAGLEGARSGLFYEYMRAVKEKRPKYFIWENVKGALSSNKGFDFAAVLNEMAEAGYSLWWQVLNAKDFGVPQNRERIFVIGFRDGSPREIFFKAGGGGQNLKEITKDVSDAQRIYKSNGLAKSQKALGGWLGAKTGLYVVRQPLKFLDRNQKNIEGDYAFTVDTSNTGGIKQGDRIRRLIPVECERLMGLLDGWTLFGDFTGEKRKKTDWDWDKGEYNMNRIISDSQRYKLCGNGVVVNVVEELIKNLVITENS